MKRKISAILLSTLFLASVTTAALPAFAADENEPEAPAAATAITTDNASLFLPQSYEQYLSLETPSHAAFSDRYSAIADGETIYLYDKSTGEYSFYTHVTGDADVPTPVSELQFLNPDELLFTDQSMDLYRLPLSPAQTLAEEQPEDGPVDNEQDDAQDNTGNDTEDNTGDDTETDPDDGDEEEPPAPAGLAAVYTNISCMTFIVADGWLYYAASVMTGGKTTFYGVTVEQIENAVSRRIQIDSLSGTEPHLAYENGVLHCIVNGNRRLSYDVSEIAEIGVQPTGEVNKMLNASVNEIAGLDCVGILNGSLYYTDSEGLHRTDLNGNSKRILLLDNLKAFTIYESKLYCVHNASILEIDVHGETAVCTGYEIAAASDSPNRLSGATDSVRAGDLLVTADSENNRVSIYHFKTQTYTAVPCEGVKLVATDGETIAMSDGTAIYSFRYGSEDDAERYTPASGEVVGIACFFSEIYFVTRNDIYGKVGGGTVTRSYGTPVALACDLYGTFYVGYESGAVYAFTERDFLTNNGKEAFDRFDAPPRSLRSDFEGNLYYLGGNTLYKNGEAFATVSEPFVFGENDPAPVSFALGYEDDAVYFCYGNYTVVTKKNALRIPTLDSIPLGNAQQNVFSEHSENGLFVDMQNSSVGVLIDLSAFKAAEDCFPYAGYTRLAGGSGADAAVRGVLLAEVPQSSGKYNYYLVAVIVEGETKTMLLREENCETVATAEYYTESDGRFWLSNDISVGYFPCMENALARGRHARGTSVVLKGIVHAPLGDVANDYAYISYEGEDGTETGFVPLSYLSDVRPFLPSGEGYKLGFLKASEEGVVFKSGGNVLTVTDRTCIKIYELEDGTFLGVIEKDGLEYTAELSEDMIESENKDALRISLIVILSVAAVLIVGVYIYLIPLRKRNL